MMLFSSKPVMRQLMPFFVLLGLLFSFNVTLCAQVTQTIHRTYVADGIQQVKLDLNSPKIEVRETKGSRILVEIAVSAEVPNETMMKFLVDNGRYELLQETDASTGTLTLATKKNNNMLMVKGKECKEELSFIIYLPSKIKFANINKGTSEK